MREDRQSLFVVLQLRRVVVALGAYSCGLVRDADTPLVADYRIPHRHIAVTTGSHLKLTRIEGEQRFRFVCHE